MLGKRPMCWLAIGFLLIICIFLMGRSYKEVLYQENIGSVYLEGKIADKQYKESAYGAYWQVTLKNVKVLADKENEDKVSGKQISIAAPWEEVEGSCVESLEGKYLCQISDTSDSNLKLGQIIFLSGKYTPWEEPSNPGQFDSGKYYCSQGILGQFRKCKVIKQGVTYSKFREGMWNLRHQINVFFRQELGEEDGGLMAAMLLGEKSGLNEEDKNLYQRNGISHILAISGLHLMLLGMGVFQVLKVILGGNKRACVISIIIMSIYCVFTGNSISTIRATIMFALSLSAGILGRSYDSLSALGLAAIVQLFINPYVLNNSGFLLSFLAVIGVTFVAPRLQELVGVKRKVGKSLCVSISSSITTLPVLLCNYGTYPWYSIFLNLFILPAMSVLLFLAVVLAGISLPFDGVLTLGIDRDIGNVCNSFMGGKSGLFISVCKKAIILGIKLILKYFEVCCNVFEHVPFQDGYLGAPTAVQIIIYGVLVILAISGWMKNSIFIRKLILLSAFMVLTLRFDLETEVSMLDVGQGDSIVIRNQNGNVYLSDCGSSSVSKVGKYRLIPFLKYKGYGRIKGVFISHLDQDHMNGIVELLEMAPEERIEIEYLFLPESVRAIAEDVELLDKLQLLAEKNKIKITYLKQGDRIKDGSMEFYCLYPGNSANWYFSMEDRNNQSLVLLMKYHDFDMLLTGDLEKEGEQEVLEYVEGKRVGKERSIEQKQEKNGLLKRFFYSERKAEIKEIRCESGLEILKVAHHGSSGSSHAGFLEVFTPKLSLICCGKNNSYGHPHDETLERLETVGSEVMSTVDSGAITLKVKKEKVIVKRYKD